MVMPTARRLAGHFGDTVHVTAWERGRVLYVASERPPGGVAAPAERVAAELMPPGTVLLAEGAGHTGGGLHPEDAERVRRRGYAVGSQRALDRGGLCRRTGTRGRRSVRADQRPAVAQLGIEVRQKCRWRRRAPALRSSHERS